MPSPLSRIAAFLGCPSGSCRHRPAQHPVKWVPGHPLRLSTPLNKCKSSIRGSAPCGVGARVLCGTQHPVVWVTGWHPCSM